MRQRGSNAIVGLLVAIVTLAIGAAPSAGSAGPVDRTFAGGAISGLAINDGPTEGSFADVSYEYEDCGKQPGETACTWQIDVGLAPEGFELCPDHFEPAATIWSSGVQTVNGPVASGPQTFALRGTPGQVLCVVLRQTSSGEYEGWKFSSGGTVGLDAVVMGPELISPIELIMRRIIAASPAAPVALPPAPTPFLVSPDCRTVRIGNVEYVFRYRQMGCWKARNLATMARISRAAPSGYHCAARESGGKRCWRQGHPRKFFEWRVP